jgi:hypothetical protein
MTKMIEKTQTNLTRIFARFGRSNDRPARGKDSHASHWYDCDVSSRGL